MATSGFSVPKRGPKPIIEGKRTIGQQAVVVSFILVPSLALCAAVPLAWVWGLMGWVDLALAAAFYTFACLGATVGFHRYFTHGSFKAKRGLRIGLAIAAHFAFQGKTTDWVGDHRRHHQFSDKEGDPHSPWLFGTRARDIARGFWHAHMGWLFKREQTNAERFAPDILADRDIQRVDKLMVVWSAATFLLPALLGGLITWSWQGTLTAFFWAGFVRAGFLHHITWSVNSVCHMVGEHPFNSKDKAGNFWPLAILSMGESWHNLHHADPTSARHGVLPGQVDISARTIWIFEKLGWAYDVRWPTPERVKKLLAV